MKRFGLIPLALLLAGPAWAQDFNQSVPNAANQKPAFAGQTRAPIIDDKIRLKAEILVDGLEHPWGMARLPDGAWLVTERPGRLRLVRDNQLSAPISGLPKVHAQGQGGLLDVAIRDDFAQTRRVWWSYAELREGGKNATAIATGTLSPDDSQMLDVRVIFQQQPAWDSNLHYGSRLVFAPDGALFVTLGERSHREPRQLAQDLGTHLGKVVRLNPDGGPAAGNPEIPGALPEIWSYGHRNVQAAALDGNGDLWIVEHGPRGGDELNRPEPGKNYGWPIITYGEDYSGRPIGQGRTHQEGMEQPIYYWDPVIAPSGLIFYQGDLFPGWQGSALIGSLATQSLVRLTMKNGQVTGEARYLQSQNRIRDVAEDTDGTILILTDADEGAMVRLRPELGYER